MSHNPDDLTPPYWGSELDGEPTRENAPFFVLWREQVPNSPMVKEGDFFRSQGGNVKEWGRNWQPIDARTIGDARRKIAAQHGVTLSPIYSGEL